MNYLLLAALWVCLRIILVAFAGFSVYFAYQHDWWLAGLLSILTVLQCWAIKELEG